MKENKTKLLEKIWKSLAALAVLYGLFSVLDLNIELKWWLLTVFLAILIGVYWHILEFINNSYEKVTNFFKKLSEDIIEIKKDLKMIKKIKKQISGLI